ncbi:MAG: glycosyltransferase [Prolixibacteraceae bacterium]|nr:glycosyltransferase [Prolixibacteraceae bacterium]
MKNNPKISVITIVYNDVVHLESTIRSVLEQTYRYIDYVIIDGNSSDGTVDIIRKYSNKLGYWSSEPDKGIYDAMNKGLNAATGDYVLFLNSGDKLYHANLLSELFENPGDQLPDVVYGETMIIAEDGSEIGLRRLKAPDALTWKSLKDGMLVCHQSFFAKRELAPMYNLNYKIAADYEWMLAILKKAVIIHNCHQIVAAFLDGGLSKNHIRQSLKERFSIMVHYYGWMPTIFNHLLIGLRFFNFLLINKRF